jgi:hypothetical protein
VTQLTATVAAEKSARIAAEKAHTAMMGGLKFTPDDEGQQDFEELQKKYGHAEARKRYPGSYAAWMKQHAPGTKPGK